MSAIFCGLPWASLGYLGLPEYLFYVDNWKNITNSKNSVRKKSFGGTFTFSNCHIIGSDTGSLVFIVFDSGLDEDGIYVPSSTRQ
jgi:hypothetical protein